MNQRKARIIVVTLIGAVAVLVALGVALGIQGIRSGDGPGSSLGIANEPAEALADGSMAPDFSLPALDGSGNIVLSELRGDVVVLNFWASWCVPCRREAPALQAAWEDYRDRGVQFIGVNHQDARASAQAYERELGITYPSVFDPAGDVALDFGLLGLPTTLIVDGDGRIAYRFTGYLEERSLREAIDDALAGGSG
jgi:cytochrome c biogenesis protein CcmG/thiol:disulfide interchange protein DsbE